MTTAVSEPLLAMLTDIGIINQLISAAATRALAPDLGLSEYGVLNHFVRRGNGETPSRLAAAFQMTKPSMTAILTKLSGKGLVTLHAHETDARSKRAAITDRGRAVHAAAAGRLVTQTPELFSGFDVAALLAQAPTIAALRAHLDNQRNARDGLA